MENVLELQELDAPEVLDNGGGGGGGGSRASLLLCGNSSLSVTTCS
jgi:Lanthionine-containing peptide SapB precursor RamS